MKKTVLCASILLLTSVCRPLCAAQGKPQSAADRAADRVAAAERSAAMDPRQWEIRGDLQSPAFNGKAGEPMVFRIRLKAAADGKYQLKIQRDGDDGITCEEMRDPGPGGETIFRTASKVPGFVIVRAIVCRDGKPVSVNGKTLMYTGGAGVELQKRTAKPAPDDFDAYWDGEIKKLSAVSPQGVMKEVPRKKGGCRLYIFQVPCGNGKQTAGYLSIPVRPGKYPAEVRFFGYGKVSSLKEIPRRDDHRIVMAVSRFGATPMQDEAYYEALKKKIGRHGFVHNDDREKCFFKGLLIRGLQAVRFLKTLPQWDGKNLVFDGGSMGGMQSLCIAGLEPAVSGLTVRCPWLCALDNPKYALIRESFRPEATGVLRYFDPVNFARRIPARCRVTIRTGIGDRVCPVNTVFPVFLNLAGENKVLELVQGATHAPCHRDPQIYRFRHRSDRSWECTATSADTCYGVCR